MSSLAHILGQVVGATAVLSGVVAIMIWSIATPEDNPHRVFVIAAAFTLVSVWASMAALFMLDGIGRWLPITVAAFAVAACFQNWFAHF